MSDVIQLKNTCDWFNGEGIVKELTDNFDVPWKEAITDGQSIDDDYYGNHSGDKPVSPLVEKLLDNGVLSNTNRRRLANTLFKKYNDTWSRAWLALQEEYDPLHNYEGTEHHKEVTENESEKHNTGTETNQGTNTGTVQDSGSDTGTQRTLTSNTGTVEVEGSDTGTVKTDTDTTNTGTVSDSGSRTNTGTQGTSTTNTGTQKNLIKNTGTQNTDNGIYGFNSSSPEGDSTSKRTDNLTQDSTRTDNLSESSTRTDNLSEANSNTRTDNLSGTEDTTVTNNLSNESTTTNNLEEDSTRTDNLAHTNTRTDNLAHANTRTDNLTETNEGTVTRTFDLTRGGNYGMTTTQKMLTEEVELRIKYNFFDTIVYPHIDKVLCMSYYKDANKGLY